MDYDLMLLAAGFVASVSVMVWKAFQAGGRGAAINSLVQAIEYVELPKNGTPEEVKAAIKRNIERVSSRMNTGKEIDRRVRKLTQPNMIIDEIVAGPSKKKKAS